ncbi:MAG: indole-3-glycerol phosphate synthase TrpC [Syntrophales bacterium]|nr:indole-3-glycerol phosphate synthase TrpC [Syntrophales bacterium]
MIANILAKKREDVEEAKRRRPIKEVISGCGQNRIRNFPFERVLEEKPVAIIAEIKLRSPSVGTLRENVDVVRIAELYEACGAAAISVITERHFFRGSDDYITSVRNSVSVPLLRKDFIIDEYQLYETRFLGAGALLLIVDILDDEQLSDYIQLADELGLSAVVEIHNERGLHRALKNGARIIGINNRDLTTFKTDLNTTFRLAPLIPPGRCIISESGIEDRDDIESLLAIGVKNFLIGEALMRAPDISSKLRSFIDALR